MSTRCQIAVEDLDNVYFYKHCDGYPEEVIPTLRKLLLKFKDDRGWDPEYLMAHICHVFMKDTNNFLGYGICNEKHGDIDYLYVVHKDWTIQVINV